ncbi:DEAD/DEAH box helicase [Sinorhizobium meliloti]|nr:DEAD/DEAH box helicase [Sinorhizobium meliloti]MDW9986480.1 DEAD/DEAH box helicase [Sinorhizobium meliloti]
MFDAFTVSLIATGPELAGVNLKELPKEFTKAYAEIVAARLQFRDKQDENLPSVLMSTLRRMRRLSATHEALVALLPDRENRAAAAFISGTAHQVYAQGIALRRDPPRQSYIDRSSVSPEVCATLLFMIADSFADAAEASKSILPDQIRATNIEDALLLSIRRLARGELTNILDMEDPAFDEHAPLDEQAQQALLLHLFRGVRKLARQLLSRTDDQDSAGGETALATFAKVKDFSVDEIADAEDDAVYSLFSGPLHLANLLLAVERDLMATAIARTPTPGGVGEAAWWKIVKRMAAKRPYLWRNHRDAIDKGYLEQGVSAAISFPTGGGKSTLAELKIAAALLRGEQVVFLAPTNALVDQTATALKKTFQDYEVVGDLEDEVAFPDVVVLPAVIVTTPERCLFLHSVQPEAFEDLGLIVFDECHLLHPRDDDRSRRAVDAMLTLLNLTATAPSADVLLLSAMMKNAGEIASWVQTMTGRNCLALDLTWKPTRQVRGTVVYPANRIAELMEILVQARKDYPNKKNGAPAKIERQLTAPPVGLFSLHQTWASTDTEDYTLLGMIDNAPHFSTAVGRLRQWRLTPNGNKLSATIAAASSASGIKTLVFVQTTVLANAASRDFHELLKSPSVTLTESEQKWRNIAVEEMGGPEYCYLRLDEDGTFSGGAASHHGLLLREERHLHESLFKRPDGIGVLFATSTLAQGMNLPAEIVIIAGDSRFDPAANRLEVLEAHEVLNAAGRAGRAGERSQGLVLVVPSRVIGFDDATGEIGDHWETLRNIFQQSDQCLEINDPLTELLDRIHLGVVEGGMASYLVSKLPLSSGEDEFEGARTMLSRSFAAYRARRDGNEHWIESRIEAALGAKSLIGESSARGWIDLVSGSTGVSVQNLRGIQTLLDNGSLEGSAIEITTKLLKWIAEIPDRLLDFVRPENLEGLFGEAYKKLPSDEERGEQGLSALLKILPLWMSARALCEIERHYTGSQDVGNCKFARQFALRVVQDLAFIAGLPARIMVARNAAGELAGEPTTPIPTVLSTLAAIVREGCDSPDSLASRLEHGRNVSRVRAMALYHDCKPFIEDGGAFEDFDDTRERVRRGKELYNLLEESD